MLTCTWLRGCRGRGKGAQRHLNISLSVCSSKPHLQHICSFLLETSSEEQMQAKTENLFHQMIYLSLINWISFSLLISLRKTGIVTFLRSPRQWVYFWSVSLLCVCICMCVWRNICFCMSIFRYTCRRTVSFKINELNQNRLDMFYHPKCKVEKIRQIQERSCSLTSVWILLVTEDVYSSSAFWNGRNNHSVVLGAHWIHCRTSSS